MKPHLRLMGGMCPGRKRSAESCQQSALSYQSPPKFQYISKKELSAVDNQRSALNAYLEVVSNLIPKTQYLIPILLLVFVSCSAALAQEPVVQTAPAAKAETEITPLKIGDRVPEELWEMSHSLWRVDESLQSVTLNDYRGKWIIIDFWNTYCGSCINSFPKNNALQHEFEDVLRILPITTENTQRFESMFKTRPFLKEIILESIVNDANFAAYFPYRTVPHLVMISNEGVVVDFPKSIDLTKEYIHHWIYNNLKSIKGKEVNNVTHL